MHKKNISNSCNDIICITNLNKWFDKFHALKNINLNIKLGDQVVICGPSGSGKSTLIRCINYLEKYQQGSIIVDDVELQDNKASIEAVREDIGMVFQQFNLFPHLTILDNLILPLTLVKKNSDKEVYDCAMEYLNKVKVTDQAHKYPNQLSGGQQQRVAIARALCMKPKVILFDEPTSALDTEMIKEVLDVMIALSEAGMTMICVTHEMGFAEAVASKMIFMDQGQIIEESNPKKFFTQPSNERTAEFLNKIILH